MGSSGTPSTTCYTGENTVKSTVSAVRSICACAFWARLVRTSSMPSARCWACSVCAWVCGPVLGLLYLATFWSGFSAAMTIVDFIIAVPMKPDENGNIWL